MNAEVTTSRRLRQRLPQWRWLYGGGVWAVLVSGLADLAGLNAFVADEVASDGQLSTSGRMVLALSLLSSVLLGALVQRLWPSSLTYRLFVPAIALVLACLLIVVPFGQTFVDGDALVGVGMIFAWIAGVVLADPTARSSPPASSLAPILKRQRQPRSGVCQPSPTTRISSPSTTTATLPSMSVRATSIPASASASTNSGDGCP